MGRRGAFLLSLASTLAACSHDYGAFRLEPPDGAPGGAANLDLGTAGGGAGGVGGSNTAGEGACGPTLNLCAGSCVSRLNPNNCGGCDNDCTQQGGGLACVDGTCGCRKSGDCGTGASVSCDATVSRCNCGTLCRAGETCRSSGGCGCNGNAACGANETCCQTPAGCRNLTSDADNCGGCGLACAAGQRCDAGSCV